MPARKPIGSIVRKATTVMIVQSTVGSYPPSQRKKTTMPNPIAQKSGRHPGGANVPRPGQVLPDRPRRRRGVVHVVRVLNDLGHCSPARYCTSASSCSSDNEDSYVLGITSGW